MTETLAIEGWAAIYDEADLNGDIVAPGAFRKSLAKSGAASVKLLYQHTAEQPVGRWLKFEERARGLYAYGELFLATQTARETAELIRADIIDGLSIGYRAIRSARAGNGSLLGRRIIEADLWEVSIVTFPMAPNARLIKANAGNERVPASDQSIRAFADHVRRAAEILSA